MSEREKTHSEKVEKIRGLQKDLNSEHTQELQRLESELKKCQPDEVVLHENKMLKLKLQKL